MDKGTSPSSFSISVLELRISNFVSGLPASRSPAFMKHLAFQKRIVNESNGRTDDQNNDCVTVVLSTPGRQGTQGGDATACGRLHLDQRQQHLKDRFASQI